MGGGERSSDVTTPLHFWELLWTPAWSSGPRCWPWLRLLGCCFPKNTRRLSLCLPGASVDVVRKWVGTWKISFHFHPSLPSCKGWLLSPSAGRQPATARSCSVQNKHQKTIYMEYKLELSFTASDTRHTRASLYQRALNTSNNRPVWSRVLLFHDECT